MSEPHEPPDWARIEAWLAGHGFQVGKRRALPGDVSPRRYARLTERSGATALFATYPPELEPACSRFLRTTRLLAEAGVPVPAVLAADCTHGWMLVEDLGPRTLAECAPLPPHELDAYFADAAELATRIAGLPAAAVEGLNPPLDRALMLRELSQTWELYLVPHGLSGALAGRLEAALREVCDRLAGVPAVVCHRDFMARNLVPIAPGRVAVLDHQDLRLGPPAYDLASLCNDTLFPPAELEERLLAASLETPADRQQYHRAAAQRTLKAAGTYTAISRRGVDRHLALIAPTIARALRHLSCLPESADLVPDLQALLPRRSATLDAWVR